MLEPFQYRTATWPFVVELDPDSVKTAPPDMLTPILCPLLFPIFSVTEYPAGTPASPVVATVSVDVPVRMYSPPQLDGCKARFDGVAANRVI